MIGATPTDGGSLVATNYPVTGIINSAGIVSRAHFSSNGVNANPVGNQPFGVSGNVNFSTIGVLNVTGTFNAQMVNSDGGTAGSLAGSFNVPRLYCN
ncbi:MAG: hypothetical protein IPJ65_00445 [Archangiaceae bacterium]|nr:hypothetical protein [Archangiaceae bacterium]